MPARSRTDTAGVPDKRQVERSFSRAAPEYDRLAALQRSAGESLLRRVAALEDAPDRRPELILDVGTGTGHFAKRLIERHPAAHVIALDLAEGMLRRVQSARGMAPGPWLVGGDAEALPLTDRSVDWVFSNLALQWCAAPAKALAEFRRVLKPGGVAAFTTFGEGTLRELQNAWGQVDRYSHVNAFAAKHTLHEVLCAAGLEILALEEEPRRVDYPNVYALMQELKGLGAHNVTAGRRRHLTGKLALMRMMAAYESDYGATGGGIQASFRILFGLAQRRD